MKRLSAIYPNQPISAELIETWIVAFDDMNFVQMSFGLRRCVKEHTTGFFPSPAVFREFCSKGAKIEETLQLEKAKNPVPMPKEFRDLLEKFINKRSIA